MSMQKKLRAAAVVVSIALGVFVVYVSLGAQQAQSGPRYLFDPGWPKPLPDRWALGGLGGVCVDANDHVLILNRQDVNEGDLNAARLAQPIIEFDAAGSGFSNNSWCMFDVFTTTGGSANSCGTQRQRSSVKRNCSTRLGKGVLSCFRVCSPRRPSGVRPCRCWKLFTASTSGPW